MKYLNNRLECDHGKLKRLIRPTLGFQSMKTAYATIKGFEVMRMFKKGQFKHWIGAVSGGTEASFVRYTSALAAPVSTHARETPSRAFGSLIRDLRREAGMSIGELASKIEVTAERLREIETGETGETGETCVEIRRDARWRASGDVLV